MTAAVAEALATRRHLVVQAGTGTGKSAAYLVPAITHAVSAAREHDGAHRPVIVVTASKALQDQLATKDLPFIEEHLGTPFEWAILKGRNNYVCVQRLRENEQGPRRGKGARDNRTDDRDTAQGVLDLGITALDELPPDVRRDIKRLTDWARTSPTGDQSELDWAPSERAWAEVSVSSEECPGGSKCPMGAECFAEAARARANEADVVVVNTFLYGIDVASDGAILPDHDVVIFDEAHQLEDVMSDTVGLSIGPGRFSRVAQALRRVVEDPLLVGAVADVGPLLREVLAPEFQVLRTNGRQLDAEAFIAEPALIRSWEIRDPLMTEDPEGRVRVVTFTARTDSTIEGVTQTTVAPRLAVLRDVDGTWRVAALANLTPLPAPAPSPAG